MKFYLIQILITVDSLEYTARLFAHNSLQVYFLFLVFTKEQSLCHTLTLSGQFSLPNLVTAALPSHLHISPFTQQG